jgi:hypothetical protein
MDEGSVDICFQLFCLNRHMVNAGMLGVCVNECSTTRVSCQGHILNTRMIVAST